MPGFKEILPLTEWFSDPIAIGLEDLPLIIAGPCSAESEKQVIDTAKGIAKIGKVKIFRAGIWKPRTRPGSFEGVGKEGLLWLEKVKAETGLLTTVEVAHPKHIELCLKHNVDILWVGARTTANPFSVQELADTLKGVDIPVMVKNSVNPDINSWVGAIERFYKAGVVKLAAVHRGFYPFEETYLRNIPKWELVIEFLRKYPTIPLISDPSHISGATEYIAEISQKALDLNLQGLMIETHINPKVAKSDAKQQVTPQELNNILSKLNYRDSLFPNSIIADALEQYREKIDSIDNQMLELLASRMVEVDKIGKYKADNNVTILQLRRWEKIISTRVKLGEKFGLDSSFVLKLLQLIHKESIRKQAQIMNDSKKQAE